MTTPEKPAQPAENAPASAAAAPAAGHVRHHAVEHLAVLLVFVEAKLLMKR